MTRGEMGGGTGGGETRERERDANSFPEGKGLAHFSDTSFGKIFEGHQGGGEMRHQQKKGGGGLDIMKACALEPTLPHKKKGHMKKD